MARKMSITGPQGPVEGTLVGVDESTERLSTVVLEDGTRLQVKTSVLHAVRVDGQWDSDGNPLYIVKSHNVLAVVSSPEGLRRPDRSDDLVHRDGHTAWIVFSSLAPAPSKRSEAVIFTPEMRFRELARAWQEERGFSSSLSAMVACPAYQQIIGMGDAALPFLVARLRSEADDPDHWFSALEAITGKNPVPEEARGDTVRMAEIWLRWAGENAW